MEPNASMSKQAFIHRLMIIPEVDAILRSHGPGLLELRPEAIVGLLSVEVQERLHDRPEEGRPVLGSIAVVFESEYGEDPAVDQVIDVFLGVVTEGSAPMVLEQLGPRLRERLPQLAASRDELEPESASPQVWRLFSDLVSAAPSLQPELQDHLDENDGELLSYLLLARITDQTVGLFLANPVLPLQARAVLDTLERAFGQRADVDEVIAGGFIENLPSPEEGGAAIADLLGPKLRAELERQRQA